MQVYNYNVTNDDENALDNVSNPAITLTRGRYYKFTVNAPGHPFWIKTIQGIDSKNAYNEGVTNNGPLNGAVTFTVPANVQKTLYCNCEFHPVMTNTFTSID